MVKTAFSHKKGDFKIIYMLYDILAPVLLNLLNSFQKSDKMQGKTRISSLFRNLFNKSYNT